MKKIGNFKNRKNLYIHIMKVTVQKNASNEISCTLLGLGYICCAHTGVRTRGAGGGGGQSPSDF